MNIKQKSNEQKSILPLIFIHIIYTTKKEKSCQFILILNLMSQMLKMGKCAVDKLIDYFIVYNYWLTTIPGSFS